MLHERMPVTRATDDALLAEEVQVDDDWWRHAVFYQIYTRSFKDSDDDGIGDLKGIISKLPYLAETGITATWLNPIFQSPMVDSGYDISDFKAIHAEYGTMEDFEELMLQANSLDIKIILDLVPNHSSDQCEWFKKSVAREEGYEDFYIWSDGKMTENGALVPPNNWQSVFYGSSWTWHPERKQFYYHQFSKEQPDLNYRNPTVLKTMDDVILFWLDKGVSGFRVDAISHLFEDLEQRDEPLSGITDDPMSYKYSKHIYTKNLPEVFDVLYHWRELLDDYTNRHGGSRRIMMTEAYSDLNVLMDYYEGKEGTKGAHFPFNFMFVMDLNDQSDARDFVFNIQKWLTYMPRKHVANWVIGNHDNPRVASRFGENSVDALNMLIMTLPGVAITYNGEEIGMEDFRAIKWEDTVDPPARNAGPERYMTFSRDPIRTPFQWSSEKNAGFSNANKTWLPVHPNYKKLNLEMQKSAKRSHYTVYKDLMELRKLKVLREGRTRLEVLSRNVFAVIRYLEGEQSLMTLINLGTEVEEIDVSELFDNARRLTVLISAVNSDSEKGIEIFLNSTASVTLIAHQGMVCRIPIGLSAERRALLKAFVKAANVILVGLLVYNLWNNKWTKLNFNKNIKF